MSKFSLSVNEENLFRSSLKIGNGLTVSCETIGKHPKDVSEHIKNNEAFLNLCKSDLGVVNNAIIAINTNLLVDEKFDKFLQTKERAKVVITTIVFWEEYCLRKEVTADKVVKVVHLYKGLGDCATSVGMLTSEFKEYIMADEKLAMYIYTNQIFIF